MKITLNQDPAYPETEVVINCAQADEDILRLVAMLRIYQKKLVGILDGERHLLDVKDVLYIDTADKKTFLYTEKQVFQSALRLYELEDALKELDFFRAGRSTILNFRRVRALRPELGRRWLVTMDNGEQIWVSRQYAGEVKKKLEQRRETPSKKSSVRPCRGNLKSCWFICLTGSDGGTTRRPFPFGPHTKRIQWTYSILRTVASPQRPTGTVGFCRMAT